MLRSSAVPVLLGLLAIPQGVDARSGGTGGFGGFRGASLAPVFVGAPAAAFSSGNAKMVGSPGLARHRPLGPFVAHRFFHQTFAGNRFRNGFAALWWGGWGWPVGGDWSPDGYIDQPVQQAQEAPPPPQVIVIHDDGPGRMTTAEATPDYSYVQGCRAIANGYHCDVPTATR